MTTKFYLDCRSSENGKAPIKISISDKGRTAYIPTHISVLSTQWDARAEKVVSHPQKSQLNMLLSQKKVDVDSALYELQSEGRLHGLSAPLIKAKLLERLDPDTGSGLFLPLLEDYAARRKKPSTRDIYLLTAKKIRAFSKYADALRFEDMDVRWMERFDSWLITHGSPMRNGRNVHFRNIRKIFNEARDNEQTQCYPFRKFKIRPEPTKSRALTTEQMQALFSADLGPCQLYLDMFLLSFCLCGISFCDLCALTRDNIIGGRVEFLRQKTGKFVSVRLTPEAQAIIDKWPGTQHLVCISEKFKDLKGFLKRMGAYLKHVGMHYNPHTKEWEGTAVAPHVSQYWARHTFSTIAADLGHSEDAIASALGDGSGSVVARHYIRTIRQKQVDAAQRDVLDAVLGG